VTNLFKKANLRIALRATNTTYLQLTEKSAQNNPSGIYKLKKTLAIKHTLDILERSITVRHKEHIRYVRTNNPISAYALHIMNNKHDYGTTEETLELLKSCHKGTRMNCWETVYMHLFYQNNSLINEQQVSDINPL
jgi:hypothetical protein